MALRKKFGELRKGLYLAVRLSYIEVVAGRGPASLRVRSMSNGLYGSVSQSKSSGRVAKPRPKFDWTRALAEQREADAKARGAASKR